MIAERQVPHSATLPLQRHTSYNFQTRPPLQKLGEDTLFVLHLFTTDVLLAESDFLDFLKKEIENRNITDCNVNVS